MTKYYDDIKIGSEVNMRIYDKIKKVKVCDIVIEAYMGHYMTVVKYTDGVSIRKSFLNDFIENIIFDDDFIERFGESEDGDTFRPITNQVAYGMDEDCISRQAVIDAISANSVFENEYNLTASRIQNAVEALPSVTPQQKTGHWIRHETSLPIGVSAHRECSCCRVWFNWDMPRNSFCPNCGAYMREVEE